MKGTIHLAALRNAVDAAAQMPRRSREMPDKPHLRRENSSTLPPVRGSFARCDERLVGVESQIQQSNGQPRLLSNACPTARDILFYYTSLNRPHYANIWHWRNIFLHCIMRNIGTIGTYKKQMCCKKCKCD